MIKPLLITFLWRLFVSGAIFDSSLISTHYFFLSLHFQHYFYTVSLICTLFRKKKKLIALPLIKGNRSQRLLQPATTAFWPTTKVQQPIARGALIAPCFGESAAMRDSALWLSATNESHFVFVFRVQPQKTGKLKSNSSRDTCRSNCTAVHWRCQAISLQKRPTCRRNLLNIVVAHRRTVRGLPSLAA